LLKALNSELTIFT